MHFLKQSYLLLVFLFTYGCGQQSPENQEHEKEHAHEMEANKEEVHLVQNQMDVMSIKLGQFQELNLSTTVKSNGQLEIPPQNNASLSALMGGRVKNILVKEGDYVTKGQSLALLEHPDFIEMQQNYLTAFSQLSSIEDNYLRKKELYEDSLSSEKTYQEAQSIYLSKLSLVKGLKVKLQLLDIDPIGVEKGNFTAAIPVRSPIGGYVRRIEINMGKFVQPQEEMFEIVDNEHIHIDLMVYEKDIDKVKNKQKVIFSLPKEPDSLFQGSIFAVGKSFEEAPKAMLVHAEIDNIMGDLLPGMYVDARIITNTEKVRALPDDAIVSDGGLDYIFVLKPASTKEHDNEYVFRMIEVNTGATDIGFTEVVPVYNLPDHVQIVTKGAYYLLAEMKKGEGGPGHHH